VTDFRFQNPAPAPLTRAQIEARFPEPPDGWTAEDDVALMEGLFMGLRLAQIGLPRGKATEAMQARFLALRKAAVGNGVLTLDAQTVLLEIVRGRVK
jgi:hypothetical protein